MRWNFIDVVFHIGFERRRHLTEKKRCS